MINAQELKEIFNAKLKETGSLDESFTKACWVSYQQGLSDSNKMTDKLNNLKFEYDELLEEFNAELEDKTCLAIYGDNCAKWAQLFNAQKDKNASNTK